MGIYQRNLRPLDTDPGKQTVGDCMVSLFCIKDPTK